MKKFAKKIAQSGFYIVLFLCISAIGVSAYVMYLARDTGAKVDEVIELPTFDEAPVISDENIILEEKKPEPETPPAPVQKAEAKTPEQPKAAGKTVPTVSVPKKDTEYVMAVSGAITEPFSGEELVKNKSTDDWRIHSGVDIKGELGGDVVAIADGKVVGVVTDSMMGNTVTIEHADGVVSIYANLADGVALKNGDTVKSGDIIGKIGQSALAEVLSEPHLHLEVTKDGKSIDPLSLYPAGEE